MNISENKGLNVSIRSFVTAILVISVLMIASYVLTVFVPSGAFERVVDENGNSVIDTNAPFSYVEGGIPFWKWLLSPVLVLNAEGSGALIAVIAFLLIVGGIFASLETCGLMKYMLDKMVHRFGAVRYRLMAIIIFFFLRFFIGY